MGLKASRCRVSSSGFCPIPWSLLADTTMAKTSALTAQPAAWMRFPGLTQETLDHRGPLLFGHLELTADLGCVLGREPDVIELDLVEPEATCLLAECNGILPCRRIGRIDPFAVIGLVGSEFRSVRVLEGDDSGDGVQPVLLGLGDSLVGS